MCAKCRQCHSFHLKNILYMIKEKSSNFCFAKWNEERRKKCHWLSIYSAPGIGQNILLCVNWFDPYNNNHFINEEPKILGLAVI